jgi:hypothetical protein
MYLVATGHITNPAPSTLIVPPTLSGLSHVTALTGNGLYYGVEDRRKQETTIKKSRRNPYSRTNDMCLWSSIALDRQINGCIYPLSLPLIAYELIIATTPR